MGTTDRREAAAGAAAAAPGPGAAFLLAQLGSYAAARFTERVAELDLVPAQTGLLRAVAAGPGQSQQALAQLLGTPPSRLVALVDALEERGILERRRNPDDRRLHAVHLTEVGHQGLRSQVARLTPPARRIDAAVRLPAPRGRSRPAGVAGVLV